MSSIKFRNDEGNTPLDPDQLEGLKYPSVTTMGELDELEDENIQRGLDWLNHYRNDDFFSLEFLNKLHKQLFGDVWSWAGKYRKGEVNISRIQPYNVGPELKNLLEDAKVWIQHQSMSWDEIWAEFHHRLVSIHPYPNGNGRIARIFVEFLQKKHRQKATSWMASLNENPQERRNRYIQALRTADQGDFSLLITFMKEKIGDK
ncbi:MAG: mobile mystery protein B [Oligoflexia bacterium]|nr:mobile mystery protein B [Oligoflexia bacterium]MBF0364984.1 mobile mystery protein B [Oligoflexia bacterium]